MTIYAFTCRECHQPSTSAYRHRAICQGCGYQHERKMGMERSRIRREQHPEQKRNEYARRRKGGKP
jgi:hypothetical protein